MKEKIRTAFLYSGFDLVGFAEAEPLEDERPAFLRWLEYKYHGEMGWLKRNVEKRMCPRLVLPSVKTIIVTGVNYYTVINRLSDSAWISLYALGEDYHDILREMLAKTWMKIRKELQFSDQHKIYVDTGPVYEKVWAQRAGIGWIGKNGCVISTKLGSFFFIGVILSSISLRPDEPHPNRCGNCTRCIQSCPTEAILGPGILDARRCISYLTIEHKRAIPGELREKFGKWIFGCDICQEVCPWNRKFAHPGKPHIFKPRIENINRTPQEWLNCTEEDFKYRFRKSPLKRLTFQRFLRNVRFISKEK